MSFAWIKEQIKEVSTKPSAFKEHYKDLCLASFILYQEITYRLARGTLRRGLFVVDKVLKQSDVIEETTLMREQMHIDEMNYIEDLIETYIVLPKDYGGMIPKPCKVKKNGRAKRKKTPFEIFRDIKTFNRNGEPRNKAKLYAIEMTVKMYRLDQISR